MGSTDLKEQFLPVAAFAIVAVLARLALQQYLLIGPTDDVPAGSSEDACPILFTCLFAGMLIYTLVIVDSYQLALSINQSATFSGHIIGVYMAGSAIGGCLLWCIMLKHPDTWKTGSQRILLGAYLAILCGAVIY